LNPLFWLRLSNLKLLDAPMAPAIARLMLLQCALVWTVAILAPFTAVDIVCGAGWLYTLPVILGAVAGIWHSRQQLSRQAHTTPACQSDYVAVS
jgi:hypothetical protein